MATDAAAGVLVGDGDPLRGLGAWAAELDSARLPEPVRIRADLAWRDTIGVMAGGSATTAGAIATAVAVEQPGEALVPFAGPNARSTPVMAAFAAAVHASALDFDDGHYAGGAIHPSSVVVACLLVALQQTSTCHDDRVRAQVIGTELALRAARLLWPAGDGDTYHCTGTAATLGAAAAVAALRGGDADEIARAIAIAWAHAPMATFQLPMVKESIGWSAATAVGAADLARAGFMRGARAVDARSALETTFPPTPFHRAAARDDPFVTSLGAVWEITSTYFKPYAACRYTHTALRSLQLMMERGDVVADDVVAITVATPRPSMHLSDPHPATLEHAQYSFPFALATMLLTGAAGAGELHESALSDERRLALAERVRVVHDPALDASYPAHYASQLTVHLRSGRTRDEVRLVAPGDPADPLSEEQLRAKFDLLVDGHPRVAALREAAAR